MKTDYDTTMARIAGNIFPSIYAEHSSGWAKKKMVEEAVSFARNIVEEVRKVKPETVSVDETVMVQGMDKPA